MRSSFIAAALAAVLCVSVNAYGFGTSKFEKEVEAETAAVKLVREVQRGEYDVITTEELSQALASGEDILVVDTMPLAESYEKNHIPGAVQFLFPIPDMTEWNVEETAGRTTADYSALLGADKDRKIVIYCGFVKCTRSHNGAVWAKKLGYSKVYRYPGGIFAWKGAGHEVESGT